jgi:GNAT superfamily N-acetyltransferase
VNQGYLSARNEQRPAVITSVPKDTATVPPNAGCGHPQRLDEYERVGDDLPMLLIDLEPGDPRLEAEVLAVLRELRPHLTAESFASLYEEGYGQGLRYLAAFEGDRCVGAAGWRVMVTTDTLRKLYVDDLVTKASHRSRGVGQALLAHLGERASEGGCQVLDLDSGVQRADAHRFYMREGFVITSFHFVRRIE